MVQTQHVVKEKVFGFVNKRLAYSDLNRVAPAKL